MTIEKNYKGYEISTDAWATEANQATFIGKFTIHKDRVKIHESRTAEPSNTSGMANSAAFVLATGYIDILQKK